VVKKPTNELVADTKSILGFPVAKGLEGKDYVLKTWSGEVKKTESEGLVGYGKAAVSTGLIVGSDTLGWLSSFLSQKKAEAKEVGNEKLNH